MDSSPHSTLAVQRIRAARGSEIKRNIYSEAACTARFTLESS